MEGHGPLAPRRIATAHGLNFEPGIAANRVVLTRQTSLQLLYRQEWLHHSLGLYSMLLPMLLFNIVISFSVIIWRGFNRSNLATFVYFAKKFKFSVVPVFTQLSVTKWQSLLQTRLSKILYCRSQNNLRFAISRHDCLQAELQWAFEK